MIELGGVDNLLLGAGVFVFSFLALMLVWSIVIKVLFTLLGKSKLYFIPKTLKELFLSVAFILILISALVGFHYAKSDILAGELFKIWEILLIFAAMNIIVRVILTGIDVHQRNIKDKSGVYRSIGLMKGTAGLLLYLIALIISIQILSTEVGTVITIIGLFIVVLFFVAAFDQIKSILAGLQLGDYYVDIGSLITIDGHTGFVDSIHGRSTLLKTIEGKTIVIPNSHFFARSFEIDPNEVSGMKIMAQVHTKTPEKIKDKISAISSKITIEHKDMLNEFMPKVGHYGVTDGKHTFLIDFKITPESNIPKIMDTFCSELTSAFGDKVVNIKLIQ